MTNQPQEIQIDWEIENRNEVRKRVAEMRKEVQRDRSDWVQQQREKARIERTIREIERLKALHAVRGREGEEEGGWKMSRTEVGGSMRRCDVGWED